jgi:polyhydroxyalkanoate synthase
LLIAGNVTDRSPTGSQTTSDAIVEEEVSIKAMDGFPLILGHFTVEGVRRAGSPVVVLCPGIGGNRFNFDLDNDHSLARYLAAHGNDVWMAELRGHGRSKSHSTPNRREGAWDIDDHVDKDAPAIIDAVVSRSGQERLTWIGHSLGGMVAYCAIAREIQSAAHLAGLITIGSPGYVPGRNRAIAGLASFVLRGLTRSRLPTRAIMRLLFSSTAKRLGLEVVWRHWLNPDNIDQTVLDKTMRIGVEDFSTGILRQLVLSMRKRSLVTADGGFDYFQNMLRIRIPVLLIGGVVDRLAPSASIAAVFDVVQSTDRLMRIFGEKGFETASNGLSSPCNGRIDYGHDDLLLGKHASSEVFPYIAQWLNAHDVSY